MSEERTEGQQQQGGGESAQEGAQPEWAKHIVESQAKLTETMTNLLAFAQKQAQERQAQEQPQQGQPAEIEEQDLEAAMETLDDAQLEAMPRRQMLRTLMQEFNNNLAKQLKPIQDGVVQAQSLAIGGNIQRQTEEFAAKTPDFHEWGEEMKQIAKEHPGMHIRRIYGLARMENPQKAGELDKQYKKAAEGGEEAGGGKGKPAAKGAAGAGKKPAGAFGGMAPSGGDGGQRNQKMSIKDAAAAAWEDTVAKFGDVFET